jgi:hypothetical protein
MARRKKTAVDILLPDVPDPVKSGVEQSLQWEQHMEKLATLADALEERRQEVALAEREKDIEYIEKVDVLLDGILDAFVDVLKEDNEAFKKSVRKVLESGKLMHLKELMIALGVAMDKREMLLGFDNSRGGNKKRMKLEVVWKSKSGEQCGVRVEAD